jgi:adenylylsulfate kinase
MKNKQLTATMSPDGGFSPILLRNAKEGLLKQQAKVIWMCGLSGAGKSTLANLLDRDLMHLGFLSQIIDGDVVRSGLNKSLGFSEEDRYENLRRVAEVAKLFTNCGVITIVSFISPTILARQMAKAIVGKNDFIEVYINAAIEICEKRDTKGLYRLAREGKIQYFTGIDSPFEPPVHADLELNTGSLSIKESSQQLLEYVLPLVKNE